MYYKIFILYRKYVLEMITPIRGRKPIDRAAFNQGVIALEMITPIRGRKRC